MTGASDLQPTGEEVETLEGRTSGIWLVTTQGSRHLWDLEAMTYTRLPGRSSSSFSYDGEPRRITRVERWPTVDDYSVVFYDDPHSPFTREQWRSSSTIRSIERLRPRESSTGDDAE